MTINFRLKHVIRNAIFLGTLSLGGAFVWATGPSITFTTAADRLLNGATVSAILTVPVTATAGSNAISQVAFSIDGVTAATELSSPYSFVGWDTRSLTNGVHTLTATATDSLSLSSSTSLTIYVDNMTIPWSTTTGKAIAGVKVLVPQIGARVDWSKATNKIVYDAVSPTGYYQVYTMNADGSNQTCITCSNGTLVKNNGNPAWDPTGQYIIFQAQDPAKGDGSGATAGHGNPGAGGNNLVYVMNADGSNARELSNVAGAPTAIAAIHPHFSTGGSQVIWSVELTTGNAIGNWAIIRADFNGLATPPISNIQTLQPRGTDYFYETHGFSPDDSKIIWTSNPSVVTIGSNDIYTSSPDGTNVANLTNSATTYDEHGHYAPNGQRISWMTNASLPATGGLTQTELWLMNPDGSNPTRLTYFNDATAPEYIPGSVIVADHDWSADNHHIVLDIQMNNGATLNPQGGTASAIVLLTLNDSTPTVSAAAIATPNPVTGSSATLTVMGADIDDSTTTLTYTWSASTSVVFSGATNGTNAARQITASFAHAGTYATVATIQDSSGSFVTSSTSVVVAQTLTSITVSTASIQAGATVQIVAAANDQFGNRLSVQPSFTWSVSSGGVINSGTGVFTAGSTAGNFRVTVTTGSVLSGSAFVTITSTPIPVITSLMSVGGVMGSPFSYTITATNNPSSFTATGMPTGLSISSMTGVISGTPSVQGISSVMLSAINAGGTGTATLVVTISSFTPPVPVITSAMSAPGIRGSTFSYTITATNSPTSFAATGMPTGLSISSMTGVISGTPSNAGVSSVTLSATNAGGTGHATLILTITQTVAPLQSPVLSSVNPAFVTAGDPSFTLTANGTGFVSGSSLTLNGLSQATVFVSATEVQATILAADIASVGNAVIGVTTTAGASNTMLLGIVALPQTPTLNLPVFLLTDGTIQFSDSLDTSFEWTVTSPGSHSVTTHSPALNLSSLSLGPGPIAIHVVALNRAGKASEPATATVTLVETEFDAVRVFPNPWRSNKHSRLAVTFDHLPLGSTVKIFDIAGQWVKTLTSSTDTVSWDRTNDGGTIVASGLYLYLITDTQGHKTRGELTIIK